MDETPFCPNGCGRLDVDLACFDCGYEITRESDHALESMEVAMYYLRNGDFDRAHKWIKQARGCLIVGADG